MPKTLKFALLAVASILLLSSCQANVLVSTELDGSGGGTFTLAVELDQEARVGIAQTTDAGSDSGLGLLIAMFRRLGERGWNVESVEPEGGLVLRASRPFKNSGEFDKLLADLRSDQAASPLGAPRFSLDFDARESFFRTRSSFGGSFDTAPADPKLQKSLQALQDFINFEVRAKLPGAVRVQDSEGTVVGDTVVWRPELGTNLKFAASASTLRVGSVLLVILPALLLAALLAWLLLGKRSHHQTVAIIPDIVEPQTTATEGSATATTTTIVLEPDPVDELLAIERDPVES